MANRYEPSKEELERIISLYKQTKNYTEVSRQTGISVTIIKRLIEESKSATSLIYTGMAPFEPTVKNWTSYNDEIEKLYKEVMANGRKL